MKWRPFDTKSFLKASVHWEDDMKRLQKEMDDISMLPSVDNKSGVRSGHISDLTAQTALRRLQIQAEIEDIKLNKEMLRYALKILTEDERELVNGLAWLPRGDKGAFVQKYGRKYGMCDTYVREKYDRVLQKMGSAILEEFYEEGEA